MIDEMCKFKQDRADAAHQRRMDLEALQHKNRMEALALRRRNALELLPLQKQVAEKREAEEREAAQKRQMDAGDRMLEAIQAVVEGRIDDARRILGASRQLSLQDIRLLLEVLLLCNKSDREMLSAILTGHQQ